LQKNHEKYGFIFNKICSKKLHLSTSILNDSYLLKRFICR